MAAITDYAAGVFTSASGTKTQTIVPALGDLVCVVTAQTGNTSDNAPTDDNADGLGTYTAVQTNVKVASADKIKVWIRDAFIGSATSTIVTIAPGASSGGGLRSLKVTGMPAGRVGATAARQAGGQSNTAAATPAPAFPGVALTANACFGAVFNGDNPAGMTPPSSWTENGDIGYNTPTTGLEIARRDSGETGSTITWGSASATEFASVIVELDTSAIPSGAEDPYPYVGGGYFPTEG